MTDTEKRGTQMHVHPIYFKDVTLLNGVTYKTQDTQKDRQQDTDMTTRCRPFTPDVDQTLTLCTSGW